MPITTTLSFAGRTEEALAFYAEVLGAETVFLMRFRDSPDQRFSGSGGEDLIFHATFQIEGSTFMASDVGFRDGRVPFSGFSLALECDSVERAKRMFSGLARSGANPRSTV